jgi:hypothetical protein
MMRWVLATHILTSVANSHLPSHTPSTSSTLDPIYLTASKMTMTSSPAPHCSSHQRVWSPDQILVQPACWYLQQVSHLPSHPNELTPVGMQNWSVRKSLKLEDFLNWNVRKILLISMYQVKKERITNKKRSSQKTILWHTCVENMIAARLLSFIKKLLYEILTHFDLQN